MTHVIRWEASGEAPAEGARVIEGEAAPVTTEGPAKIGGDEPV